MRSPQVPEKPTLDGLEAKWQARWEAEGTYRFDRTRPRPEVFSIDTPPLTASGTLHAGHVFSYTHTDLVARYQRMRGRSVFYPVGWDDNGLPTERRVENLFGVRGDASLPYDPDLRLQAGREAGGGRGAKVPVSRRNFLELCERQAASDERAFEQVWRRIALSVDWSMRYQTIGERSRLVSQRSFLRLLAAGEAYQAEAPTIWDVTFRTAVAQAELEDREVVGAAYRLRFTVDGRPVVVETTRPELLPACVALVAHPGDERYRDLVGRTARTPLFGVEVPVLAHHLARPDKGTGIAMSCTFGDTTDVTWWRELGLPVRSMVTRDGRVRAEPPEGVAAGDAWKQLAGLEVAEARRRIAELLQEGGELVEPPRPITHPVSFYERGERPLEIVTSRQWFIRLLAHRERLLARGRELDWHPPFMRRRYEDWVEGLTGDWLVSRQRFFGVPVPLWYPVGADGAVDHDHPIVPAAGRLPVDPAADVPDGFGPEDRDRPGGFTGDPDVLDTWATSSLTPLIAGGAGEDPELFERVFPMNLRPQGQEIIRTWLFYTVVRAELELGVLPWSHAAISGWVVDPDRAKLSKSRGNALSPIQTMDRYGADALRHWAAGGRLGSDTTFDEDRIRVGRRLAIKVLNASRFVLGRLEAGEGEAGAGEAGAGEAGGGAAAAGAGAGGAGPASPPAPTDPPAPTEPLDRAMLAALDEVVGEVTAALDGYDHTRALERAEAFFWRFCDDHLELVKDRAYGTRGEAARASASAGLRTALDVQLRLLAPFLPYVTEEVWSWWRDGSIHRAAWPERLPAGWPGDPLVLEVAGEALAAVRRAKTRARRSMRAPVARLRVVEEPRRAEALRQAAADLRATGAIAELVIEPGDAPAIEVQLGEG
jgi:valyl-tRNA synthetase